MTCSKRPQIFSGATGTSSGGGFVCNVAGLVQAPDNTCNASVAILNAAIGSYNDGSFIECAFTTPTTTQSTTETTSPTTTVTSTVTTSVTSTGTITPLSLRLRCVDPQNSNAGILGADGCEGQVRLLNSIIGACTGANGTFACQDGIPVETTCPSGFDPETHTGLTSIFSNYTGVRMAQT